MSNATPLIKMRRAFRGIPLNQFYKNAAIKDALTDTASGSLFGLADANGSILLGATSNNTTITDAALTMVNVPDNWVSNSLLRVIVRAKVSVARTVSATILASIKIAGDTLGSELGSGVALSCNSTVYRWYGFDVTTAGLLPGRDIMSILLTGVSTDTGGSVDGAMSVSGVALEYEARA